MSIGTTIKKLRREREITQEQLADMLGVTACAVSQWECDRTAPDISQIPILASVFEVSADVLLEIDLTKSKRAKEISDFSAQCEQLHRTARNEERLVLCREMIKKYPNDETVIHELMRAIESCRKTDNKKEHNEEIIKLGERLITSSDPYMHRSAISALCFAYHFMGNHEEAVRYAKMNSQGSDLLLYILKDEELREHSQYYFISVCDTMYRHIHRLIYFTSVYTNEELHAICKKMVDVYYLIYENADFTPCDEYNIGDLYFQMAKNSAVTGNTERAIDELEEMVKHFDKSAEYTQQKHTSLLINTLSTDKNSMTYIPGKKGDNTYSPYLRALDERMDCFAGIANHPRFLAIKEMMSERANPTPS